VRRQQEAPLKRHIGFTKKCRPSCVFRAKYLGRFYGGPMSEEKLDVSESSVQLAKSDIFRGPDAMLSYFRSSFSIQHNEQFEYEAFSFSLSNFCQT
jgi:hypothetical protein